MLYLLLIIYMGAMAYLAANGFGKKWNISFLPELMFAMPIGYAFSYTVSATDSFILTIAALQLGTAWAYIWMQTGHADTVFLGKNPPEQPPRDNTLTPVINFIAKYLKFERDTLKYDLLFLGVKGFLITLPVGGSGAFLWPLAHWIGNHSPWKPDVLRDALSGFGVAISIILFLVVVQ